MKIDHSTLLRPLGVAHVVIAIMLLPANLFLGFLSIMIVLPVQIWLFSLGIRLWRLDSRIQAALRLTHLLFAPFAILLIVYGVYALRAATGSGLLGSFGLLPMTLGACSGLLALWSLYVASYTSRDMPISPELERYLAPRGQVSNEIVDRGNPAAHVDGFVAVVADENRDLYISHARAAAVVFKENGALSVVEFWGDGVLDEDDTSLPIEVKCRTGESLVFAWITWSSKDARNDGMKKVMADPRLRPESNPLPFAGQRQIYGGFKMIVDE